MIFLVVEVTEAGPLMPVRLVADETRKAVDEQKLRFENLFLVRSVLYAMWANGNLVEVRSRSRREEELNG